MLSLGPQVLILGQNKLASLLVLSSKKYFLQYQSVIVHLKFPITVEIQHFECFYMWHDDVIKWKHFPRNWPFVRGIHRSPVNSPHKGQWHAALMLTLICLWLNDWVNNREAGDLRRYRAHYDVIVMTYPAIVHGYVPIQFVNSKVLDWLLSY